MDTINLIGTGVLLQHNSSSEAVAVNGGESGRIVASRDQGHLFLGFFTQSNGKSWTCCPK